MFCIRICSCIALVDLFAFSGSQLNQGKRGMCLTGQWLLQTFSAGLKSCVLMVVMTRSRNWPELSGLTFLLPAAWVTTLPLQKNNAIWILKCVCYRDHLPLSLWHGSWKKRQTTFINQLDLIWARARCPEKGLLLLFMLHKTCYVTASKSSKSLLFTNWFLFI